MRIPSRRSPALFLGLSLAAFAASATLAEGERPETPAAPLRCEISLSALAGGTRIEGRVEADSPLRGTWRMQITSRSAGGRSSISQSGDFDARPGAPATLGETDLMGTPAQHHVTLTLRTSTGNTTCAQAEL